MVKHLFYLGTALALLVGSVSANAQTLESVRVRLPNGQLLSLTDGPNQRWWRDERVVVYQRYYYEPQQHVYVVYNDNDTRHWPRLHEDRYEHRDSRHDDHRDGRFCPPGQAKKGRC